MNTQSDVRDTPEVIQKYGDAFEPRKENWEPLRGDISFRDVTFRYPDGEENVLGTSTWRFRRGLGSPSSARPAWANRRL